MGLFDPAHVTDSEYLPDKRFLAASEYHVVVLVHPTEERLAIESLGEPNGSDCV